MADGVDGSGEERDTNASFDCIHADKEDEDVRPSSSRTPPGKTFALH